MGHHLLLEQTGKVPPLEMLGSVQSRLQSYGEREQDSRECVQREAFIAL
jgi:hypothetical protein